MDFCRASNAGTVPSLGHSNVGTMPSLGHNSCREQYTSFLSGSIVQAGPCSLNDLKCVHLCLCVCSCVIKSVCVCLCVYVDVLFEAVCCACTVVFLPLRFGQAYIQSTTLIEARFMLTLACSSVFVKLQSKNLCQGVPCHS
jgi:hypothetical protein